MRIRILAAAVVTAGALMVTLTGAASADTPGTPSPPPSAEKGFAIVCGSGADGRHITARKFTEEEMKELRAEGGPAMTVRVEAMPAEPAGPGEASGTPESGGVTVTGPEGVVKRLEDLPEGIEVTLAAPAEPGEAGTDMKVEVVPAPADAVAACAEKKE